MSSGWDYVQKLEESLREMTEERDQWKRAFEITEQRLIKAERSIADAGGVE